jgi:hypothetical protein
MERMPLNRRRTDVRYLIPGSVFRFGSALSFSIAMKLGRKSPRHETRGAEAMLGEVNRY